MRRLRCVECNELMELVRVQPPRRAGVTLDLCSGCGGTWFDKGELDRASRARLAREPTPHKVDLLCPVCQVRLFEEGLGEEGDRALSCNRCQGLWVPGGTLDHVVRLHPTVAAQPEPEPEPAEKPWTVSDAASTCARCGATTLELRYSFIDPSGWLCRRCHGETSWDPLERLETKAEGQAGAAFARWFRKWMDEDE